MDSQEVERHALPRGEFSKPTTDVRGARGALVLVWNYENPRLHAVSSSESEYVSQTFVVVVGSSAKHRERKPQFAVKRIHFYPTGAISPLGPQLDGRVVGAVEVKSV